MTERNAVLGVDFGGVIQGGRYIGGVEDTTFLHGGDHEAMRTPEVVGASATIARLGQQFGADMWIISKCGPRIAQRTLGWLEHHHFYSDTGIDPSHVRFCRERHEKATHCRELNVTHFIDDRIDVLQFLAGLVPYRFLFGGNANRVPAGITPVGNWAEAETAVVATISRRARS